MTVKLHDDLVRLFLGSFYRLYKLEIYEQIKSIESMTMIEFSKLYGNSGTITFNLDRDKSFQVGYTSVGSVVKLYCVDSPS